MGVMDLVASNRSVRGVGLADGFGQVERARVRGRICQTWENCWPSGGGRRLGARDRGS